MREGGSEDEKLDEQEKDEALGLPGRNPAMRIDGVEIRREHHDAQQDLVGDFDGDVRDKKGFPAVGFGGPLAHLVEIALRDEARHDLLHERREDGRDHEDGEDHVLQPLLRGVGVEEGKSYEERGCDTEK